MNVMVNRRRFRRIPLVTQVVCEGPHYTACMISRNISEGGMLLEAASFDLGDEVRLSFVPPTTHEVRRMVGVVVWREKHSGMGIQFLIAKEVLVEPAA